MTNFKSYFSEISKFEKYKNKPIETENGIPKLRVFNIEKFYDLNKNVILLDIKLSPFVVDNSGEIAFYKSAGNDNLEINLKISPEDLYITSFKEINENELTKLLYSYAKKNILFSYKQWLHEKAEELQKNEFMKEVFEKCDFLDKLNKELNNFF
jgi:hypothetical protein